MRGILITAALCSVLGATASTACAQSSTEAAALTHRPATPAQNATPASPATPAPAPAEDSAKQAATLQPGDHPTVPAEERNRRELESNAGPQAGKVLLRSQPTEVDITINGLYVGKTPLLLILAPGKYTLDARGPRQETEHRTLGVMPKDTQTVLLKMNQTFPASIGVRWPGQ
jgi:hypothetical protein